MGSPGDTPAKKTAASTAKKAAKKSTTKATAKQPAAQKPKIGKPPAKKPATKTPVVDEDLDDTVAEPVAARSAILDETAESPDSVDEADAAADAAADAVRNDGTEPQTAEAAAGPSRVDRIKAMAAAAAERAETTRKHLEASRERSRTVDAAFGFAEHDAEVGGGVLAGAVAFRTFLFLIPYVFVLVTLIGLIAELAGEGKQKFANAAGVAGIAARAIAESGAQSILTRLFSLVAGGFALYLAANALLKVLRIVHGLVWHVPVKKFERPTRAVGQFILIVTGMFFASIVISGFRDGSLALFVIGTILYVAVPAGIWLIASMRVFPHADEATWREVLPGAAAVGIGFQLLQLVTIVWITHLVDSKSATYGAIGVALALLFWAYVLGRIVCGGAVLNAALWTRAHAHDPIRDATVDEPTDAERR